MSITKFIKNRTGSVATMTAVASVPILLAAGTAVDYAIMSNLTKSLQTSADNAALASAKELALASSTPNLVKKAAQQYAIATLSQGLDFEEYKENVSIETEISRDKRDVTVYLSLDWEPMIMKYVQPNAFPLTAKATATLAGSENICIVALDEATHNALLMSGNSSIQANSCAVYSNSTSNRGISVTSNSTLKSSNSYSAGGYKGPVSSYKPIPIVDTPPISDPLVERQPPVAKSCDYENTKINKGSVTLSPGTYCGGISISGGANVSLKKGNYIMKDGPLVVNGKSVMKGTHVGFVFEGENSTVKFGTPTTISLTAPRSGPLAGILFFENRNYGVGKKFTIQSRNAERFEGTVYLPKGTLIVSKESRVGHQSNWTAIIAKRIIVKSGPQLKINANYAGSNIPVPKGVGPQGTTARLSK